MKFWKNLTLSIILSGSSQIAVSTPQLVPTDQWLFEELNGLVNRNILELDLSTFPLSKNEVRRALGKAIPKNQSDQLAIERIKQFIQEKRDGFTLSSTVYSALPKLQLGMNNAYDQYRSSVMQSFGTDYFDFYLQANYSAGETQYRSRNIDFVNAYVAIKLSNQWLSFGQQQRYWGSAHTGSLILGDAARPIIGVNMQRDVQTPFETKWLSWLGNWQYQLFAGQTLNMDGMHSPKNSKLIGARFNIKPTNYLELGASRVIQWGGKGRPQNWRSFGYALIGRDNAGDNVSAENEPGNQIAGIDFRIRLMPLIDMPVSIYGQMMGEDESKMLPSSNFYLVGIDGSYNISQRQTLNWYIEGADTSIDRGRRLKTTYRHYIYKDGYYHQKLPLGYPLGGDMRVAVLGLNSTYTNNDITALVRTHSWDTKLLTAKNMIDNNTKEQSKHYQGIEVGWTGTIPIDKYISLKLKTTAWHLSAKNEKSQTGIGVKADLSF